MISQVLQATQHIAVGWLDDCLLRLLLLVLLMLLVLLLLLLWLQVRHDV